MDVLPIPPGPMFCEVDDLLDQLAASKKDPQRRGRGLPRCARCKRRAQGPAVVEITDPS